MNRWENALAAVPAAVQKRIAYGIRNHISAIFPIAERFWVACTHIRLDHVVVEIPFPLLIQNIL